MIQLIGCSSPAHFESSRFRNTPSSNLFCFVLLAGRRRALRDNVLGCEVPNPIQIELLREWVSNGQPRLPLWRLGNTLPDRYSTRPGYRKPFRYRTAIGALQSKR